MEWIDEAIQQIKQQELELEIEDSVAGFLGVHGHMRTNRIHHV